MHDLIKLTQQTLNDEVVNTVNARELHEFLESKQEFSTWIKKRIEKLRLLENKDYILIPQIYQIKNSRGGDRKSLHYAVTLDAAKHIALMENTDKGFEVREYFIECEKQLQTRALPQTYSQALRELADSWDREQVLLEENKVMKPKAEYFDDLVSRRLLTNFRDTAKELKIKQNDFIEYLISHNYIYRDNKNKLRPYSQYTPELFELKEFRRGRYTNVQTLITPKGRETFRLLIVQ